MKQLSNRIPDRINILNGPAIAGFGQDGAIAEMHSYPLTAIAGSIQISSLLESSQAPSDFNRIQEVNMESLKKEMEAKYDLVLLGTVDNRIFIPDQV